MNEFIIPYHYWIISGFVLMLFEMLTPGFFALWIGLAAVIIGGIAWMFQDLGFIATGSLFIVLAAVISWYGKIIYKKLGAGSNEIFNQWDTQYIGNVYQLDTPMDNGNGKVKIGDTVWPVKAEDKELDLEKGQKVKVIASDGIYLIVQPIPAALVSKKPKSATTKKPAGKGKKNDRRRK